MMLRERTAAVTRSRQTVVRFCLKVLILLAFSGLQILVGNPSTFGALVGLSALLSVGLALYSCEVPIAGHLNYWDEACAFGAIFCAA